MQSRGDRPGERDQGGLADGDRQAQVRRGDSGQIRQLHRQRVHRGPDRGQHRRRDRLVRATRSLIENPNAEWRMPTEGCDLLVDKMVIPVGAPNTAAALAFMNFVYRPGGRGRHHGLRQLHDAGRTASRRSSKRRIRNWPNDPTDLPDRQSSPSAELAPGAEDTPSQDLRRRSNDESLARTVMQPA